jgi:hypothetical protein
MDIMQFAKQLYLVSVDDYCGFVVTVLLPDKRQMTVEDAINKVINVYKSGGHKILTFRSDSEAVFISCEEFIGSMNATLTLAAPENHDRVVERAIRSIKDKTRALIYSLPYVLPSWTWRYAVEYAVLGMNSVPNVNTGVRSPNEFVQGKKLIYEQDVKASFGTIIESRLPYAGDDATGPRSETGVVVGRHPRSKGMLKVYMIASKRVVKRYKHVQVPLTEEILNALGRNVRAAAETDDEDFDPDGPEGEDGNVSDEETLYWDLPCALTTEDVKRVDPESLDQLSRLHFEMPAYNLSIKKALQLYDDHAVEATNSELEQLIQQQVWEPVYQHDIKQDKRSEIIPSHMFLKMKTNPVDGSDLRLKGRLVAGGNLQTQEHDVNNSSPTVDMTTLFTCLGLASYARRSLASIDVKGAYLNASLDNKHQYMRLSKEVTKILVDKYRDYEPYICSDGCIVVRLLKALYGLRESALLWFRHLRQSLISIHYKQSIHDQCLFYKTIANQTTYVLVHVDDLLVMAEDAPGLESFYKEFRQCYNEITISQGESINYLGMSIRSDAANGEISISQIGYVGQMLERFGISQTSKLPCDADLFKTTQDNDELVDKIDYLSKVMSIMYLAKRSRPDLLMATVFAATKSSEPRRRDEMKLMKVFNYINATRALMMVFTVTELQIYAFADASYAVHGDGKSHSGAIVSMGRNGGTVFAKSGKQKLVTLSSTEAELVAVHDAMGHALHVRNLVYELTGVIHPVHLMQDNMSTIGLITGTGPVGQKSRHINVRYFSIRENIADGSVVVSYLPTAEMKADILTKPLTGELFFRMRNWVLNQV